MQLNSHIIKLTGSAELNGELDLDSRYAIGIEVGITDKTDKANGDGTFDVEYKARLIRAQVHTKEGKLDTKDKTHESVKTRRAILALKNDYRQDMDDEAFYQLVQQGIRAHLSEIINMLFK